MTLSQITDLLMTKQDADKFCQALDAVNDSSNKNTKNFIEVSQSILPIPWHEALLAIAKENNVDLNDKANVGAYLETLKKSVQEIPSIECIVAVDIKNTLVKNIAGWCNSQLPEKVLLDLQKDESLVGAATISFNGHYKNYSVKKSLDEFFTTI